MAGDRGETRGHLSRQMRLANGLLRALVKPRLAQVGDAAAARRDMERAARWVFRAPPLSLWLDGQLQQDGRTLPVTRISQGCGVDRSKVVLYFHGGAFVAGSPRSHRGMLARISRLGGVPVVAPDYRLAPEHPFPAALEDARLAWAALYRLGYDPQDIVLGGDSAGGQIAFALLSELCAQGTPPAGLFAFSPWVDLTGEAPSIRRNAERDALLPAARFHEVAGMYLAGQPPEDPRVSPLWARFPGAPPVLLQYSETEILCDDTLRMAAHLRAEGAEVVVQAWPDAPHVWHLFDGWLPEARDALGQVGLFLRARLTPAERRRDES